MQICIPFLLSKLCLLQLFFRCTFAQSKNKTMSVLQTLQERSNNTCELCTSKENLKQYTIPPSLNESVDNSLLVCSTCLDQIEGNADMDVNHWRCLNDSMWSEFVAVQIMAWRMLQRLTK